MKRVVTLVLCLTLFGVVDVMAKWQFTKTIYRNKVSVPHGVAVDPTGKIWVGANVRSYDTLGVPLASIAVIDDNGNIIRKIQTLTVGGVIDTLKPALGCRGIMKAKNGDMLYSAAGNGYRINSTTYQALSKFTGSYSITMMGETDAGEVIVGPVSNGNPIRLFTANLGLIGAVVDTTYQIARVLAVSPDGNDIYLGSTTGPGVVRYRSAFGTLGPYTVKDTILKIACESMKWRKGNLWMASRDTVKEGTVVKHLKSTWYEWNPTTGKIVDSMRWNHDTTGLGAGLETAGVLNCTPRGMDFSLGGDTAYVCGSDGNALQVFRNVPTSVEELTNGIPEGFTLSQNYPNPFNPTTEIQFSLTKSGFTTLKVYDILGKEVSTLVSEELAPGAYKTKLDASNMASGTYIYVLTANGQRLTNKMMLMK